MPQLEANGTQLHFQTLGHGDPVVMLHGLLVGNMSSWYFGAAAKLSDHHEVLLYDLRGHGMSQRTHSGYNLETMVRDLEALIQEKKLGAVSLVGHSYGALIALHFAIRNPQLIKKLVLVEAPLPPSKAMEIDSFLVKNPDEIAEALPENIKKLIFAQKRQAKKFLERLQFLILETDLLKNLKTESDIPDATLKKITTPTLLVYSKQSQLADVAERLAHALPQSQLEWLDGGHYLPSEKPLELSQKISEFFL